MRRELQLDDFEIPSQEFKFQIEGEESSKSKGINTDEFQMKSMRIETIIRNSDKQHFTAQVNPHIMAKEMEDQRKLKSPDQKKKYQQNYKQRENSDENGDEEAKEQDPDQEGSQEDQNGGDRQLNDDQLRKMERFLKRVSPLMENQLSENLPQYSEFGTDIQSSLFKRDSRLTHTLQNLDYQNEELKSLQISDVAWNATGIVVAAAYARTSHEGTCSHKSMISLWFLYKRNFRPTKPETINTPNCINCVSFHPKKPSILACGSYTGEILLYDFSKKEEQLLAKTIIDDYFHRDLITQLSWWAFRPPGRTQTEHNLLSLGTDGKILLWEMPNQSLAAEEGQVLKSKTMLQYPIKGYLMLRKKEGKIIPVSGLSMNQSKMNRNMFIIGSEGGSILRATLTPINHHHNTESKVILDLQQNIKFKPRVYPFLLNIPSKNLPDVKNHIEQYYAKMKSKDVDSVDKIFSTRPEIRSLYPNPISFAYEPLSYPISSISDNRYGLFIANGCDGYSRMYIEGNRKSIESIQDGWEWGWIDSGSRLGGFIGQQWVVIDFLTEQIVWSVSVGEGTLWKENGYQVAIVCEGTKVKIVELGDKILMEDDTRRREINKKVQQLTLE